MGRAKTRVVSRSPGHRRHSRPPSGLRGGRQENRDVERLHGARVPAQTVGAAVEVVTGARHEATAVTVDPRIRAAAPRGSRDRDGNRGRDNDRDQRDPKVVTTTATAATTVGAGIGTVGVTVARRAHDDNRDENGPRGGGDNRYGRDNRGGGNRGGGQTVWPSQWESAAEQPGPPTPRRSFRGHVCAGNQRERLPYSPVDPDAVIKELDPSVRRELSSLPGSLAEKVAGHLAMTARLLDDEPELAFEHARTAHDLAPRIVAVREALAAAAYKAGDYRTAIREARTVRRMAGDESWLPMIADCERGLGRPERALDLLTEVDLSVLPDPSSPCLMVLSGARGDLGQYEAALAVLWTTTCCEAGSRACGRRDCAWRTRMCSLNSVGPKRPRSRVILAAASDPEGLSSTGTRLADVDDLEVIDLDELAPDEPVDLDADERAPDDRQTGGPDHSGDQDSGVRERAEAADAESPDLTSGSGTETA